MLKRRFCAVFIGLLGHLLQVLQILTLSLNFMDHKFLLKWEQLSKIIAKSPQVYYNTPSKNWKSIIFSTPLKSQQSFETFLVCFSQATKN